MARLLKVTCQGVTKVGLLNDPHPNPDDYNEGRAIYFNELSFYSMMCGPK